jgi:hypothetical protein
MAYADAQVIQCHWPGSWSSNRFAAEPKTYKMKTTTLLFLASLAVLIGCSKDESASPAGLASVETRAPGGCTVFPPGIVKAPARFCEVEILESNSDFINHIYLVSPVEMFVATDDDWGTIVELPEVSPNDELIFEIRVHDPSNVPTGDVWQTGPASRNADGAVHAIIHKCPRRVVKVNFEDIHADGWGVGDEPNYVDAVFEVRPQ